MAELFERIDSVSDTPTSDRVNALSRSNKDRSDQTFAEALKKKLKDEEQKKKKDELILDAEGRDNPDEPEDGTDEEPTQEAESGPDDDSSDHIDIKA